MSTLVARKARNFHGPAVNTHGDILESYEYEAGASGKYSVIFFYPLAFTFVCPTELIALDKRMDQFNERDIEVIAISVDSPFTNAAWRNTPIEKGGIGPVRYPIFSDMKQHAMALYEVKHPDSTIALRAAFIVDKEGIVRSQIVNDLPIGRNIDELIRLVDALQFHEQYGEVCPAGWKPGDKAIEETSEGIIDYLAHNTENL